MDENARQFLSRRRPVRGFGIPRSIASNFEAYCSEHVPGVERQYDDVPMLLVDVINFNFAQVMNFIANRLNLQDAACFSSPLIPCASG